MISGHRAPTKIIKEEVLYNFISSFRSQILQMTLYMYNIKYIINT